MGDVLYDDSGDKCLNPSALEALWPRTVRVLHGYLRGRSIDASTREDVIQDAFVKIWEKRSGIEFKSPTSWFAYCKRTVDHLIIDRSRSNSSTTISLEMLEEVEDQSPGFEAALTKTLQHDLISEVADEIGQHDEANNWKFASIQRLQEALQTDLNSFDPSVVVTPVAKSPTLPTLDFKFSLEVQDTHVKGMEHMGHGLRRSLVFAMLTTLSRISEIVAGPDEVIAQPQKLTMFLIEEPELYLHPQAERERMRELQRLGDRPAMQVLACTHSAFFVDITRYKSVLRFIRPARNASLCYHWEGADLDADEHEKLKTARALHPSTASALFADLAIICEGDTELVCVAEMALRLGIDTKGVEVVECGGGGTVPTFAKICDALGVHYTAWVDRDQKDTIKKLKDNATAGMLALIVLVPDWEGVAKLPRKTDEKPWRSYKHFVLDLAVIPEALQTALKCAYSHETFDMTENKSKETISI